MKNRKFWRLRTKANTSRRTRRIRITAGLQASPSVSPISSLGLNRHLLKVTIMRNGKGGQAQTVRCQLMKKRNLKMLMCKRSKLVSPATSNRSANASFSSKMAQYQKSSPPGAMTARRRRRLWRVFRATSHARVTLTRQTKMSRLSFRAASRVRT